MHTTRNAATAVAALAALLLTGCASLGATTPAAAPTDPAPAASTGPASTPASSSPAQAIRDWYNNGGQTNINTISADMTKISADGNAGPTSVATDCQAMLTDVTAAQAANPIPDKQAQLSWASALGHLHQGASDCTAGATNVDAAEINKSATEFSEGTADLNSVAARIKAIAAQ